MQNKINDIVSVIMNPLYNYISGDKLFGLDDNQIVHHPSTNIFHVRANLDCYTRMKIFIIPTKVFSLPKSMFKMRFRQ